MSQCPSCGRELKPGAKFCGGCGIKIEVQQSAAAVCPSCGRELKPGAKFCGGCGTPVQTAAAKTIPANVCPSCGRELKPGAKFCGGCGTPIGQPAANNAPQSTDTPVQTAAVGGFITWKLVPGQIAIRIDAEDIAEYGPAVKGIVIPDGLKALVFNQGQFLCEVGGGQYTFADGDRIANPKPKTVGEKIWSAVASIVPEAIRNRFRTESAPMLSFVLMRGSAFPVFMELHDFQTASVKTDIGLQLNCEIGNILEFYRNLMLDTKSVGFTQLTSAIEPTVIPYLNQTLGSIPAESISNLPELNARVLPALQSAVSQIYPFITITAIVQLTAKNDDLDNLRRMNEELYVSEKELEQLVKRNAFADKLQEVQWEQELKDQQHQLTREERSVELEAAKEKIYERMQLTDDEREKFDLMLAAQKKLREAKTQDDVASALQEYRKSGLVREQELENLQHQIEHGKLLRDLSDTQILEMTAMQNQQALEQRKAEWEMLMGTKRLQSELEQKRMQDAYSDERRNADASFSDSRRQADLDFDRKEQQNQMDMLRQAQAIRNEREDAEHRRDMEAMAAARQAAMDDKKLDIQAEQARLDAANEEKRIYAGMSFEQIMAANPNISPEAAQALAKKFEAEAASAQNDKTAEMAINSKNEIKELMQQQMAMMQQMAMQQMNNNATIQQTMAQNNNFFQQQQLQAKQSEMDRVYRDSQRNNADVLNAMSTTVRAVSDMNRPMPPPQQRKTVEYQQPPVPAPASVSKASIPAETPADPTRRVCPNGHVVSDPDTAFCPECGTRI